MKNKKCFVSSHCIDGSCPKALQKQYDYYDDYYDVPKSCKQCWYHKGTCDDCIFQNSEMCDEGGGK